MSSIHNNWHTRVLTAATLAFLTTGYTSCNEFSTVTVPSRDYVDPVAYTGRYVGGQHVEIAKQLVLTDVTESVLLIGSGLDAGGVKDLEVTFITHLHCCSSATSCFGFYEEPGEGKFHTLVEIQSDHQDGRTYSRVSNGMWLNKVVQPQSLIETSCPMGTDVRYSSVEVSIMVETEDFRWNEADKYARVTYNSPNYAGSVPFYVFK